MVANENSLITASENDSIVSAELSDKEFGPIAYVAVSSFMMHGPCSLANLQAPCMKNIKCKKVYPKQYRNYTIIDEDGFP